MKRLLGYLKEHLCVTILAPLFKMLEASFELFVPLVVASMIDVGIGHHDIGYLWKMGGLLYVVIANRGRLGDLSGKGMMLMVLLGLYCGMTSTGVDNLAHIGGLVCGFILALILYRKKKKPAYTAEWIRQSAGDDL